ncbi:histidine phosphatase family protein [Pseudonocardia acidicola]|uniref:Histidine phosphatase family protein n=1 Tax=Pseudonocardia acidicola TaxID=2724939 RepID=A0ABX1S9G8_9PSEU|nr:histidine phosphatase family protein [Pseudonocardia acidicola]NMH98210.1 histidine phosphatase family protein [Pseudonocardia acidicola]
MELTLVRHGEPVRGADAQARFDPGLSERGRAEVRRVAEFLAGEHHDAVYVSPLRRARETAEPIAELTGLQPVVEDGLAEFDRKVGYTHFEDLRDSGDPRYAAYLAADLSPWETDAETFRREILAAVDGIVERHPGQRVLLVTHGGVENVFLAALLDIPGMAFHAPAYASISRVLAGSGGRRTLISINETGHLRGIRAEGSGEQPAPAGSVSR